MFKCLLQKTITLYTMLETFLIFYMQLKILPKILPVNRIKIT